MEVSFGTKHEKRIWTITVALAESLVGIPYPMQGES